MKRRRWAAAGICLLLAVPIVACGQQKPDMQQVAASQGAQAPQAAEVKLPDYWPTAGWRTSSPEAQGMHSEGIAAAIEAYQHQNLHSVAIVRNGYMVTEAYNSVTQPDVPQDLRSVTKSFTSALTGIALHENKVTSLEEKLSSYLPQAADGSTKAEIQLGHLLYMASGLDWDNNGEKSTKEMSESPDWIAYILNTPSRSKPGTVFHYSNGDAHLMSAVLQKATGQTLFDYAKPHLFEPMGINGAQWKQDPQGHSIGAWSIQMTTRDMAKFGYLYLHKGLWDGAQLLPTSWVEESWKERVPQKYSDGTQGAYGYYWWMKPLAPEGEGELARYKAYYAAGSEGQRIFVVPGMDLIVAVTAYNTLNEDMPLGLLTEIVKAVDTKSSLPANEAATTRLQETVQVFKSVKDEE
ncbi:MULTISPECIES: serine hydrolase domain-containing protein [Paenibacillus]|uniref:serine hydrolase domain-containing protein n=1 Tax=Paenibacillus TaxID=44249 RepID=UPI0022B92559|nr:serine hydrolase [Paenibacillus caseinilyticus]MCZ8523079.1 serine hydrolase [Paenibacillus caseinilyticus]